MKKLSTVLALVLILTLVFSLSACGKSSGIVGTWKADMNLADFSGEKFFDGATITMILELNDDDTYKMYFDEDSVDEAAAKIEKEAPDFVIDMAAEQLGMTAAEVEDMMAMQGMSEDDLIAEMDINGIFKELKNNTDKGTYTYEDDELVLTSKDDEESTWTVELDGDKMKVTKIKGEDLPEDLLPLTFKR